MGVQRVGWIGCFLWGEQIIDDIDFDGSCGYWELFLGGFFVSFDRDFEVLLEGLTEGGFAVGVEVYFTLDGITIEQANIKSTRYLIHLITTLIRYPQTTPEPRFIRITPHLRITTQPYLLYRQINLLLQLTPIILLTARRAPLTRLIFFYFLLYGLEVGGDGFLGVEGEG